MFARAEVRADCSCSAPFSWLLGAALGLLECLGTHGHVPWGHLHQSGSQPCATIKHDFGRAFWDSHEKLWTLASSKWRDGCPKWLPKKTTWWVIEAQKEGIEIPPHLDHPILPGEKKKKRNLHPMVPQVKRPLQGPVGEEGGIHPTLMTLKLTFRSLKGS